MSVATQAALKEKSPPKTDVKVSQARKKPPVIKPTFTVKNLFEAGVHYGHSKRRRNPRFSEYVYAVRDKVHIIDLQKTAPLLARALQAVEDTVAEGGRLIFVGTKRQAAKAMKEAAIACDQFYVCYRWPGGMLTNWQTVSKSLERLEEMEKRLKTEDKRLTKKEKLSLTRRWEKLDKALGGIRKMKKRPEMLFVMDIVKESNAVDEAITLGMPVVAVVDSNADPGKVDWPIPGNDDSARAISFCANLVAEAVEKGRSRRQKTAEGAKIAGS